jgi:hypothetical protein
MADGYALQEALLNVSELYDYAIWRSIPPLSAPWGSNAIKLSARS